jgi:hypothetical protein
MRMIMQNNNMKDAVEKIKMYIVDPFKLSLGCPKFFYSAEEIDEIARTIISCDEAGSFVASCVSIALLVHVLLYLSDVDSELVLGVCIETEKLFAHAWVETAGCIFDYRSEELTYKEIKRINIKNIEVTAA